MDDDEKATVKLRCPDSSCGAKTVVELHGQDFWKCDTCGAEHELAEHELPRQAAETIEPFVAGQWVAQNAGRYTHGLHPDEVRQLTKVVCLDRLWCLSWDGALGFYPCHNFRHATPAEVAEAEKPKRCGAVRKYREPLRDEVCQLEAGHFGQHIGEPDERGLHVAWIGETATYVPAPSPPDAVAELREAVASMQAAQIEDHNRTLDHEARLNAIADGISRYPVRLNERLLALETQLRELTGERPLPNSDGWRELTAVCDATRKRAEAAEAELAKAKGESDRFEKLSLDAINERDKLAAELDTVREQRDRDRQELFDLRLLAHERSVQYAALVEAAHKLLDGVEGLIEHVQRLVAHDNGRRCAPSASVSDAIADESDELDAGAELRDRGCGRRTQTP